MSMQPTILRLYYLIFTALLFGCNTLGTKDKTSILDEIVMSEIPNRLAPSEKENGWVLLFDGVSPTGWHGYNQTEFPACWMIEDGTLTTLSTGGGEDLDILTDSIYKSFALSLEFKLDSCTNSGIIFQVNEDSIYKYPYETGPEFQVIDQDNWPDPLEAWQLSGANYAMYPPLKLALKPLGEWNHALLIVDGTKVTQMLNGIVMVDYEKYSDSWKKRRDSGKWLDYPNYGKYDEGHIDLQNHGTKVWYRSIKLKKL